MSRDFWTIATPTNGMFTAEFRTRLLLIQALSLCESKHLRHVQRLSTISAQTVAHLNPRGGLGARETPLRIAKCGIGVTGEIQLPDLLGDTRQLEANHSSAGLVGERCSGEDSMVVAIVAAPLVIQRDNLVHLPFSDIDVHVIDV